MKKILLTLAAATALLASPAAFAQTSAVTNAILNQRSGLLDKARTDIDQAALNEKTSGKAKTWYTRGDIYEQMMDSPIYGKQLKPGEGVQKAYESYAKAIQLDGKTGEYGAQADKKMDNIYARAFNDGVNAFNAKDYTAAIASYKLAAQVKPADTTVVLYSAYAADAKQDYAESKIYYNQLLGMGYKSPAVYSRLLYMAKADNNPAEAQKILDQALAAYPGNKNFLIEDLNKSISTGSKAEALTKVSKTIAADPGNSNLYAVRGGIYDQQVAEEMKKPKRDAAKLKQADALAVADYRKAVELDPKNFDAQFNLGVHAFNRGVEQMKEVDKLSLAALQSPAGKAQQAAAKKSIEDSTPYFENALALHPEDQAVLFSMRKAYCLAGNKARCEALTEKEDGSNGKYYINRDGQKVYLKK